MSETVIGWLTLLGLVGAGTLGAAWWWRINTRHDAEAFYKRMDKKHKHGAGGGHGV